jgi:Uma2 family endonuclease
VALQLARYRISVDEYERMIAAGAFDEALRIELINGEIVEMSPIGPSHMTQLNQTAGLLYHIVGRQVIVSVQNPIRLPPYGEPQPDIALLRLDYSKDRIPGVDDLFLVMEMADTTIAIDRRVKLPMYADAGIPETWLFDIQRRVIERHTHPVNSVYSQVASARRNQSLTSTVLPQLTIRASLIFD